MNKQAHEPVEPAGKQQLRIDVATAVANIVMALVAIIRCVGALFQPSRSRDGDTRIRPVQPDTASGGSFV